MVTAGHPDAEQLALYADGGLAADARLSIEEHLAECEDCRDVVADTVAFVAADSSRPQQRPLPFRRRWVMPLAATLAAAAAIVIAIRIARPDWLTGGTRSDLPELQELVAALANEPTRPVEGRLSGGFKYAPPPSATRGPGSREPSPEIRIAAARLEQAARASSTPQTLAALGVAFLATGQLDNAVTALEGAVRLNPDASYQNDLAAAYLARQRSTDHAEDLPKALAAAERSWRAGERLPEACFNRALALEYLQLAGAAEKAWQECLAMRGGDPRWNAEVTEHLERIRRR